MAGFQRSAISFRRQGSSRIVWSENFLSAELNQDTPRDQQQDGEQKKPEGLRPWPAARMQKQDGPREIPRVSSCPPQSMKHSRSDGDLYHHSGKDVKASNVAGLPRSTLSFRRQGSSGVVWDDSLFPEEAELNEEKPKERQDGQKKISQVVQRTPQRISPSQSKRTVRYRCCNINDVFENSIIRVRLWSPRLIAGDRSNRPSVESPIKVGTKPRKDRHQRNYNWNKRE